MRSARQLGQQFTNLQLSGSAAGPISLDKAFYSFSWQLGRRSSTLQDLLNTDPLALERVGVSAGLGRAAPVELSALEHSAHDAVDPEREARRRTARSSRASISRRRDAFVQRDANGRWNGQDATNLSTTAVPVARRRDARATAARCKAATRATSSTISSTRRAHRFKRASRAAIRTSSCRRRRCA